ncbi:hypothetical protein FFJ24_009960 [Pedobacter sp. KBS0701]|uniref:hypothetical protein n=1 Tax=Pedobacter sp. KBS0701 TaxID=2578106 RepID=UPI00110E8E9A|nr:hypothetical protein [Pedobacter sp. KBS0701]QDW25116.1 hypothetical protein FFJ24_009960 [Pedobacter sp. KBS0701]
METYRIALGDGIVHSFEVAIYPHHQQPSCRYGVFQDGKPVASLSPDTQGLLYLCQNPGNISGDVLDLLCEAIELRHPRYLPGSVTDSQ